MEVKYIEELKEGLVSELEKIASAEERQEVLGSLVKYCMVMEQRQQLRVVVRESYDRMVPHVFNYLRRNRQLERRVGAFDKEVKTVLCDVLSNLLVDYGTDKG